MARRERLKDQRGESRDEAWVLIRPAASAEYVIPSGEKEVAELVGCPIEDLTSLPYGVKSEMWMSRAAQISDDAVSNRPASYALKLHGLPIAIRGPVVVHHEKLSPDN